MVYKVTIQWNNDKKINEFIYDEFEVAFENFKNQMMENSLYLSSVEGSCKIEMFCNDEIYRSIKIHG